MTIFNIGDYFLNNDCYLCKIINISQDANGKLCFYVHIIDTDHLPIFYATDLERHVFKHLGNNEEVAQTLYKLNDEEIEKRRQKYETRTYKLKTSLSFIPINFTINGFGNDKDSGD